MTVIKGNSVFKFGADLRDRRNSNFDGGRNGGTKGQYQYGTSAGGFASGNYNGIGANDTGSAVANTLLGYQPGFVGRGTPGGPFTLKSYELAFFVQDDWKVSPELTLNLGLRYDIFTSPVERFNRQANFDPNTGNIIVASEDGPNGRDLVNTDYNNIGPRLGFAYSGLRKDRSVVLRGGYGIIYTTDVSGVQPLTANPGTGAANFSCTPITNPGGPGTRELPFTGAISTTRYDGYANYNAFQSKLEKRFSEGLSILSAYTYSKAIDNSPGGFCFGGQGPTTCGFDNPQNPGLDRALSGLDVPHRFTFASVYDLPIGKGRKYLANIPLALEYLIGGWQFNNIVTLQSGPVFTPNFRGARPDIVGDPTPTADQRANGILINPNAFAAPTQFVFAADANNDACYNLDNGNRVGLNYNCPVIGTLGRNTLRGDSQEYWDASLFKNFAVRSISEAFNIQLRISAFNVLNHVNRSTPNGNIEDANFGRDFSEQRRRQMEFALKIIF